MDIRGSGASSGVLTDEYTEQEQEDVCSLLAWVAAQPWCTGSLGMIGLSWGGFAALQAMVAGYSNCRRIALADWRFAWEIDQ